MLTNEDGVDVGNLDAKVEKILIPVDLSEYHSNEETDATLHKVLKNVYNVFIDFNSRLYVV